MQRVTDMGPDLELYRLSACFRSRERDENAEHQRRAAKLSAVHDGNQSYGLSAGAERIGVS